MLYFRHANYKPRRLTVTYTIAATTEDRTIHSWAAGTDRVAAITCASRFAQDCARVMYPLATKVRVYEHSTDESCSACIACYEVR